MSKIYKTILLFSAVEQLAAGLELQNATATLDCETWVLDDFWPLDREQNLRGMEKLKTRWPNLKIVHAPENLGIHNGFNYLTSKMPLNQSDFIIQTAPDTVPITRGWDDALVRVLKNAEDIAYVSQSSDNVRGTPNILWEMRKVDGLNVMHPTGPAIFQSLGFKWSFLSAIGGFWEPCSHYGYIEGYLYHKAQELGLRHAYLEDFIEVDRIGGYHPPEYTAWKVAHTRPAPNDFKGNFAAWLEVKKNEN